MAQEGSSLGDEKKASQDSGVFNSILNTVENVGEKVLEVGKEVGSYVKDTGKELLGTGADMIEDTAKAGYNLITNLPDIKLSNIGELYGTSKQQKFNDFDKEQAEKLNSLGTMDMVSGITGIGKSFIKSGVDKIFGNEIINNLKVNKSEFDNNVNQFTNTINLLNNQLQNIDRTKYQSYLSFEDKVRNQYLKDKGISNIQDESDFELYKRKELERLNAYDQSNIIREQNQYFQDTDKINSELNNYQNQFKDYLNNSINPLGDKTGEQLYNEFNENKDKDLKNNEYIKTISKIYDYSKQQVEDGLEAKGLAKVSDWSGYDSMKDSIIDDVSAENQYYMTVLGMKDLPDHEVLANKAKEVRDVSYKFKIDFMNNYMNHRNDDQFKGMSDLDIKNAVQKMTWDQLSLQDKDTFKQKEKLVTEIAAVKNYTEMKDRFKEFNPKALIDLVGGVTSTLQGVINQAYDFQTDDVPHFVKQDMRNIVYSGEGIGKNVISALTYNPDTIATIILGTKGLDKLASAATGIQTVAKTLAGSDKVLTSLIKVGEGSGTLRLVGNTVKNLTSSQLYGAIGDTALDNVMIQAPDKATEGFNQISNMLFDTTPFVYKEAKTGLEQSTTLNKIAYDYFINKEDKNAIKQFADVHNIDAGSAKVILDNGIKGLYNNLFNPKEYESIMKTPGALYKFVGDNISNMDKTKVNQILTEKGIGLQRDNAIDGLTKENRFDISDAWNKSIEKDSVGNKTIQGQFNTARLDDILNLYKDFITPGKGGSIDAYETGVTYKINNDAIKDERFNTLYNTGLDALKDIKIASNKTEFDTAMQKYDNALRDIRRNYSNIKNQQYIRLVNPYDDNDLMININELQTWTDKNLFDLNKEGKVKIVKKDSGFYGKELKVRTQQEINSEKFINDYLTKKSNKIKQFEIDNGLNLKNQSLESTLRSLLFGNKDRETDALVRNFFGDLSKKEEQDKMHNTVEFINSMLQDIMGTKYIKNKPNFINSLVKDIDKETGIVKMQDIKNLANSDESYLSLSYGYFKPKGKDDYMFAMYILPGKKILDDEVMNKSFTGITKNKSGELTENITYLRNQGKDIVRNIINLGISKDGFNFDRGLIKTKSLYSAGDVELLFVDGILSESKVNSIVHGIYGDQDGLEDLQRFIYKTLENVTESESLIVKPIIYNFTLNYSTNKKLIDKLLLDKVGNFEEIFSDLLLSPKLRDLICEKISKQSGTIPEQYKVINVDIYEKVKNEWHRYETELKNKEFILQDQLKELESYLDNDLDDVSRVNIQNEIDTIKNRINAIETNLKREGKFSNEKVKEHIRNMYSSLIKSKIDNLGGEILGTVKKIFTGEEIKTLDDKIKEIKSLTNNVMNGSDEFKKSISDFLKVINSDDKSLSKTLDHIENITDDKLKTYFNRLIELKKNFGDIPEYVYDDELFNDLTRTSISGVLNHEWALENNPIKKKLNAFLNNSSTGQDEIFNNKIIKYFNGDDSIKNIDELFDKSNDFKQFISEINLDNINDKDLVSKKSIEVVTMFRDKIKSMLSGEVVQTNKSNNISDELIEELIKDRKLFQRFKNLKNRNKLIAGEGISAINIKVSKGYSGYNQIEFIDTPVYVDKVIQFENMKNKGVDFKLLNGFNSKTVKYFKFKDGEKFKSLSQVVREHFNKLKIDYQNDEKGYLKAISGSPITEFKLFSDIFNGIKEEGISSILTDTQKYSLLNQSRLLDYYKKGYVFVGGLGDKDSQMHLYRMPKEFDSIVSKDEFKKLSLLIYNAEYAYANGYLQFDRKLNTFEDFKKELLNNLGDGVKSYKTIEEEFLKLSNKNLEKLDVIRKREASNASNFKTFGEYKEPVKLYIIDELIDTDNALYNFKSNYGKIKDFLGGLNENNRNDFKNFIDDFIQEDNEIAQRIKKELEADNDYNKILTYINNTYANDLQDGTSFISEYLIKLRGYLNGLNKHEVNSGEYKQFKDHFFGENEKTNGVRVFGKTLFNSSEIKEGGELIDNAVAIGKSSLKLAKDIYKKGEKTVITIDGRKYNATIIEGTDTSFFKNAATDLFEHEEEQTFSDSIKASLSKIASEKITLLQKNQIQDLFKKLLSGLGDFNLDINSYSSIDKYVNDVIATAQIGYSTSSMLGSRLTEFLSGVDSIINKPQDKGQSMFIRESSLKIKTNEVIMNKDSQIVKQIFNEVKEKMYPGIDRLSKEQEENIYNNLYTIGYRYPVPSKYNIGVYKIILSDDKKLFEKNDLGEKYNPYERMGTNQVIPHPETTYMKLEGDNDGDHIFFISTNTDFGKVIAEDVLNKKLGDNVYETLSNEKFDNDFIVISQVEKIGGDKDEVKKEYKDLLKSRISAIEAKSYIGNVSATIRTIKLLDKEFQGNLDKKIVRTIQDGDDSFRYENDTLESIKKNLFKGNELKISDRSFSANAAQLLQTTLDFGNSGLDQFNPEWFMQLLDQAFPSTMSNLDKFKVQDQLISALSMGYKGNEFKSSSISKTNSSLYKEAKGDDLLQYEKDTLNKNLYGIIGDKRELLKFLYEGSITNENGKKIIIGDLIGKLNKTQDLSWLLLQLKNSKSDILKKYVKLIESQKSYKEYGYLKNIEWKYLDNTFNYKIFNNININEKTQELAANVLEILKGNIKIWEGNNIDIIKEASKNETIMDIANGNIIQALYRDELNKEFKGKSSKVLFDKLKKYLSEDDKYKKELLGKELFPNILNIESKDARMAFGLFGMLNKEYKILNFALGQEIKDFLQYSDQQFIDRLNKEITDGWINIPKSISKEKKDLMIKELMSELDNSINTLKAIESDDTLFVDNKILELENTKSELQNIIDNSEILKSTEKDLINQYKKQELILTIPEYNLPGIEEKLIDISKEGVNLLLDEGTGYVNKSINNLSGFVSTFFGKYSPKFLSDYNNINDLLGHKDIYDIGSVTDKILTATTNHLYDFNEYLKDKNSIIYQIKNTGIDNYKDVARKIQYELIDYVNGNFIIKNPDKIRDSLRKHLEGTKGSNLIDSNKFIDRLTNYQKTVISNIADILNNLESQGYKVFENYKGSEAYSLITDVLEANKADAQLALRLNGFKNREMFEKFISEQVDSEGGRAMQGTIKTMADVLYSTQGEWYDKILGFLKGTHYSMNYGTMSIITGNGIMSGVAQMLPNYVELRSYLRKNITDIKEGFNVMQSLGLLDSESVLWFGSGIGKDLESGWIDGTLERITKSLGLGNIKSSKAATLMHSLLTNPLGGTDYPIENLRKCVAITNTMKTLGIKNAADLERRIKIYGKDFEGLFRSEVRKQFAESGGGVNSSSAIYKDTIFNHLSNYADIWGVRFLTQTMGYLMGWSFHKSAKLIEKESTLYYGIKDLVKGNYKGFKAHIDDWFTYNSMLAHQAMLALGIYMKMEKYEKDINDGVSFDNFAKTFMNSVVSMNILLEKHLNSWESADEYSGTLQDKIGYTTVGFVRNIFRLFGQTAFIATMYKHYTYSQIEGKANLFDSLQFAMNEHYSSFIRFNGIDAMDNVYNTLSNEGKLAMLGTGAKTSEEEMFQDLQNGNYFGMYKEKGFIKGMYDMFDGLLLKSATSVPVGLQNKISSDLVKLVMEDKELSKLIRGGQFGNGSGDYNIERLYGKIGSNLTEEQIQGVTDLYKQFADYNYNYLDSTGIKKDSYTQSSLDRMLHEQIDSALKKEGLNIEDLISKSNSTPELLKTLAVLESKYGLKNPLVISLMIDNEYNKRLSELKESKGKLTGEVSKYGTAYKEVLEEDKVKLKRDLLIKYQSYFNLNRQIGMDIISQDIQMNHKNKLDQIKNIVDKYGNSQKDMEQYLKSSYLIGQVSKEGDTSVSKLHSRYALAAKGLAANETTVKVVNSFLNKLFNNETLSNKEKLANAAGFLSGLDKATYGMLSNNEEFNKLTDQSKKLLMNWVFKINKESINYDSKNLLNDLNNNAYGGKGSGENGYFKKLYPKYKSNSFEGERPGFSKQFSPLQKMLRPQYVDRDYDGFIRKYNQPQGDYKQYNNLQSPVMRKYKDLLIEQLFYGYKSKGIINQYSSSKKIDNQYKKDIKIKKGKSVKEPVQKTKPKKYIPYKQNLYSGPLNTYVGN